MGAIAVTNCAHHPTTAGSLRVYFSEAAIQADGETPGNYGFAPALTVFSATMVPATGNKQFDLVITAGLARGGAHLLTVVNVRDVATSTPIAPPRDKFSFSYLGQNDEVTLQAFGGIMTRTPEAPVVVPPAVSNVLPSVGTAITKDQLISFDVTDDSGVFRRILVTAQFTSLGYYEVVHDGQDFAQKYLANSVRTAIVKGYHYALMRSSGWPASPTILPFAIDAEGGENP